MKAAHQLYCCFMTAFMILLIAAFSRMQWGIQRTPSETQSHSWWTLCHLCQKVYLLIMQHLLLNEIRLKWNNNNYYYCCFIVIWLFYYGMHITQILYSHGKFAYSCVQHCSIHSFIILLNKNHTVMPTAL